MIKPTFWLSLLTAVLSADHSASNAATSNSPRNATCQFLLETEEERSEQQRINDEARRTLGRELLEL